MELHPGTPGPESTTTVSVTLPGDVRDAVAERLWELTDLHCGTAVFDDGLQQR
ncbi:hypothetical protein ACFY7C_36335 [Streptomyces sp. NPDC012769]|uniref:hypothetical protein n=1 Tax=Streptomyces sp. NPDC012769 TaxID=3364848 RepID=UPI0036C69525